MATRKELQVTSFDHDELKASLIDYLKSTQEFGDFDYEGSAINTLVDLLVRNTHYDAYMANFLASESFLDSAQIRASVVSHASKLSYVPRSRTSARLMCDIVVTPPSLDNISSNIVMEAGTVFLVSDGNSTFSFTTHEDRNVTLTSSAGGYVARDIQLFQGQRIRNQFVHTQNGRIEIPNPDLDTSTIQVDVASASDLNERVAYNQATAITELDNTQHVFFLGESTNGLPTIEFGHDILGVEPADDSVIYISGINVEREHANGASSLIPASTIAGYSNIQVTVTSPAIGGVERENMDEIRYLAPKAYQSQERALTDTDYIPIIKRQFPFVRSAISWGGENNNPPRFGSVFISILSDDGSMVTPTIQKQIASYVSNYNVGSITPVIVNPTQFYVNVDVAFVFDKRKTNKTFNELTVIINDVVREYCKNHLNNFGLYYNESRLISNLTDIHGIVSINIDKTVSHEFDVLRFNNPVYEFEFDNEIEPGSLSMKDFTVAQNGTNHQLTDDTNGAIILSYDEGSATTKRTVGSVDYQTGTIEFTINMIQEDQTATLYVNTVNDNFYVEQNSVVSIGDITTRLLETRTR